MGSNLDPRKCKSSLPRDASKLWAKRWALNITAFQYARAVAAELQVPVVEFDPLGHPSLEIYWLGEAALKVRLEPK